WLLGPVALAAAGRNGLFWLALLIELLALALLGNAWGDGSATVFSIALGVLAGNRAASTWLSGSGDVREPWALPLALLLVSQVLTIWRAVTPDAAGSWLQFPADRDSMLAVASAIDQLIGWSQVTFENVFV